MKIELGTLQIRPRKAFKMDEKSQIFQFLFSKKNLKTFFSNPLLQSFKKYIAGIQKKINQIGPIAAEIIGLELFKKSHPPEPAIWLDLHRVP